MQALDADFSQFMKDESGPDGVPGSASPSGDDRASPETRLTPSVGDGEAAESEMFTPDSETGSSESWRDSRALDPRDDVHRRRAVLGLTLGGVIIASLVLAVTGIEPLNRALSATIVELGFSGHGEAGPSKNLPAE